ncbi:RagB/SusD family nutrient uptake outer membrane protein [Flammeovirga sp. MY04]|uniref:RagB/SusD family nutrient uptake outer membrane protein n=1 Tax=Flammeovirga sp. MY04 TaxID=1191459 RepID=UPI000806219F|nr:RagB/SusD family nutrient uptake outer membrane protein [Flammeovirga sp. MY04]ANQ50020.1 RagB/SusD family nutrient uptake outer membrane protein [Flammeovirga sp. MY04]
MKLKNILSAALFVSASMGMTSCESFLDLTPPTTIGENNFFETNDEIESATIGIYAGLQEFTNQAWAIDGICDDNTFPGTEGFYNQMNTFTFNTFTGFFYDYYRLSYMTINRANMVLEHVDKVTEENLRNQLKGEALFLRAYLYHQLVQAYGHVPLVLTPIAHDDYTAMRNDKTVAEIYTQISADLEMAIPLLPASYNGSDLGRATSWAAKGILAKVRMNTDNNSGAKLLLEDIINNGPFSLQEDYKSIFENEMNSEILFAVRYSAGNNEHQTFSYEFSARGTFGGVQATQSYLDLFDATDIRKDASSGEDQGKIVVDKYSSVGADAEQSGVDWVVLRLADVKLLYAEILNEEGNQQGAVDIINEIRTRAKASVVTATTPAEVAEAVALERRLELAFEGHRWQDLKRYGMPYAMDAINAYYLYDDINGGDIQELHKIFPLPQREVNVSQGAIIQNEGYL